jgi:hypothetical protein
MAWGEDAPLIDAAEYLKPKMMPPGAGPGEGGGPMTQPRITVYPEPLPKPRQQVVDFWKSKGAPEHVAEGIADRVKIESGFDPVAPGDSGTSIGLYQHHADRKSRLTALPGWQDPQVQNEFAYREVTGGDKQATEGWEKIRSAKTREEAAKLWDQYFERSKGGVRPSGGWDSAPVVSAGNWRVSPRAVQFEQGRRDTNVVYMNPADYLAMTPPLEGDGETRAKRRSLAKSLALGDDIEAIPTLDVKAKDGKLEVYDQDGRNRAMAAQEAGVDLIPVAVHGVTGDAKEIIGMRGGEARPFDFMPVPKVESAGSRVDPTGGSAAFYSGVRSTAVEGPAQLLEHVLPKGVASAIRDLNNTLSRAGLPLREIPEGGMDEIVRRREAELEKSGAKGSLPYVAGEIAGTLPLAAVAPQAGGAGVAAAIGRGAIGGAVGSAMEPVTAPGDNFWWEKGKQAATGAAAGGALAGAGRVAGQVIGPALRPQAQMLVDEGVRLTPGQMAGGAARRAEDAMGSIPIVGSAVRSGQRRAIEDFNRAAWNRVLAPLGTKLPKDIPVGREAAEYVEQEINRAYDQIIPNLRGQADRQFVTELQKIAQRARNELPDAQFGQFSRLVRSQLLEKTSAPADGSALHVIDSMLKTEARQYKKDALSWDNRKLGYAIQDLQLAFRSTLERQNPRYAGALGAADRAFANFVRVDRAAASVGAPNGVFTPAQLSNAVRAEDPSLRKKAYGKGKALLQDLSDAAKDVLPRQVPDSGTPERLMIAGAIEGHFSPEALAASMAASLPYTGAGMNALRSWITAFPKARNALAQPIRRGGAILAPGAGIGAENLFNRNRGLPAQP